MFFKEEDVEVGRPILVRVPKAFIGATEYVGTVISFDYPYLRVSNETKPEGTPPCSIVCVDQVYSMEE